MSEPTTLGQRLSSARVERNVTQKQLAQHFHVQHSTISMVESGELEPSEGLVKLIKDWIASGKGITMSAPRGARGNYR
jgi:transcriptional regulator with XRE-family HTH domain